MMDQSPRNDGAVLDQQADLATILDAWQSATCRLQQTHEALRSEVSRLTEELAVKNRQLARKNRLADLGQIAAHVAHEIRNSLVPVKLYLSLLRRRTSQDDGALEAVDKLGTAFAALDTTVEDLLHFSSDRTPHWEIVQARGLLDDLAGSLLPQLAAQRIRVILDVPRDTRLRADQNMLRRAVLNLLLNALDAMPAGGELVITSCLSEGGFELEVADSGTGLSEEAQRRAFEPFYTSKASGTGLGLAIVDHIAQVHGGDIQVRNCPEGGAAFTLRIPQRAREELAA